ncbi:MAG: SAM-dependent methyltransferase [Chloroflexi bacterium]|nr:SAM-dependent methyltransferase [Chloroflexota bacterium]
MPDTTTLIRQKLKSCDLRALFIEELGWNHHRAAPLIVEDAGVNYVLNAIAEKHGMVAYECQPGPEGQIPDYPTRGKIERQVAKSAHEHIVVFVNRDRTTQTWQWVRREKGKPTARREHPYVCDQTGDLLIQKLQNLMVSLEEEEKLTIVEVADKARQAFDIDRVTKRFYDRFKEEHKAFLSFIEGITAVADREWYASLMLNRLMFIYFIQKKGFLDGDIDYLRNRLQMVRQSQGKDKFHSFYRLFLRRLFHEGLAQRKEDRKGELNTLLGNVPYLNGGLFDTHQLEKDNPNSHIADAAFERLFDFFDAYQWRLDERPARADNEINPDVLGYIFEKYINQKQMGAYYTKEDITEYISKSTIVPFLFDAAEKRCAIAFAPDGAVWRLLRDDPDRYIYDAVKKGVDLPLPEDIAAGIADVSKRGGWNRPADGEFALPTETWREHVARRTRCLEVRGKLANGEIHSINDLITHNLDLRQFAQDVIQNSEGPDLLRAFDKSIEEISVLDPTCGSGAFLFAALNILEPLYEACLERMEAFVEELDKSGEKHHPEKFSDFRKVLAHANDKAKHPKLSYFILKTIVLRNLYGVDIMAEAVEICKLRLFLKLVAQVERVEDVEPLPDIDFNIRAGNTLVGFISLEAVRQAMTMGKNGQHRMASAEDEATLKRIEEDAEVADWAFQQFRDSQSGRGMDAGDFSTGKELVRESLQALRGQLDRYLATEYAGSDDRPGYEKWRKSHQPFHWFVEFYGIMHDGGFDVVIGNPPYVEYPKVRNDYSIRGYEAESCGNTYAFVIERSIASLRRSGRLGMIVQLPIVCTDRMKPLQEICFHNSGAIWFASFDDRPARLFDGLEHIRACIFTFEKGGPEKPNIHTTSYNRWYSEARNPLFRLLSFEDSTDFLMDGAIPKIGSAIGQAVRQRLGSYVPLRGELRMSSQYPVHFHNAPQYWIRAMNFIPYFWNERDGEQVSTQVKSLFLQSKEDASAVAGVLNSSLFYWWFILLSDCRHLNMREIDRFPVGLERMETATKEKLVELGAQLMKDFKAHSQRKEAYYKTTGRVAYDEFYPKYSKPIIDQIDRVLAKHYGFTEEELDFIINYDIKYRMGADSEAEDE